MQKDSNAKEIWFDEESKALWSDVLPKKYSHFDAIKYDGEAIQIACATLNPIEGATDWVLPELNDYVDAYQHRYLQVFSTSAGNTWLWTATLDEGMSSYDAHAVSAISAPDLGTYSRANLFSIRCLARVSD